MNKLNSKHYIFIAIGLTVVPIKTYTSIFLKDVKNESWIPLLIASIILCVYAYYCMWIFKQNNCYNICKIYKVALGNILGYFFLMYFSLSILLTLIETSGVIASLVHTNLLIESPIWYILLFVVPTGMIVGSKSVKSVIITSIICVLVIMFFGINLSILVYKYKDYNRIFPIFQYKDYSKYLLSTIKFLGGYSCFGISYIYLSRIERKQKIMKDLTLALVFIVQLTFVSVIGLIATFQMVRLLSMSYPTLFQTQLVEEYKFIGLGELFVILQVVLGWNVKYFLTFKALLLLNKDMKLDNKYVKYILSGIILVVTYYVSRNLFNFRKFLDYYVYVNLVNIIIIPLIIFTLFHIRNRKNRIKEDEKT